MIKFSIVDKLPTEVKSTELVIGKPDFLPEIKANSAKAGRGKLTGVNHLRNIVDTIGMKYDTDGTNSWSVRPNMYEGRLYNSDEELSAIVLEMLEAQHPSIFKKFLEFNVNRIPAGTELIIIDSFFKKMNALSILTDKGILETTKEKKQKVLSN